MPRKARVLKGATQECLLKIETFRVCLGGGVLGFYNRASCRCDCLDNSALAVDGSFGGNSNMLVTSKPYSKDRLRGI